MANERDRVFISYAHQDKIWLEKLQVHLKPLERDRKLIIWNDTRINPGDKWRDEISRALAQAKVAVMLMSPHFLASDFISKNEVPALINAAETEGLTILWVSVSHCVHKLSPVAQYQAVNDPAQPLDSLSESESGRVMTQIAYLIMKALNEPLRRPITDANVVSTDAEQSAASNEAKAPPPQKPQETTRDSSIHIEGDVNRGIINGNFGDNTTINFGDNSGNK